MKTIIYTTIIWLSISVNFAFGQTDEQALTGNKNAIEFSPLSPLMKIYAAVYSRKLSQNDELLLGAAYMNIHYDFGNTNSPALIVGYRKNIWGNLHIEYQVWPAYDKFYEKNENKHYESFDVWNEFRLGYKIDFNISNIPCHINLQWPFGFGLYASNKPNSFIDHQKGNEFFYFPPLFFLGVEF